MKERIGREEVVCTVRKEHEDGNPLSGWLVCIKGACGGGKLMKSRK